MAIKVAFIGAGSVGFCCGLFRDILAVPEFADTHFAFTDINAKYMDMVHQLCSRDIAFNNLPATVTQTLDRRRAVADADYVINCTRIGGLEAFTTDIDVPLRYGLDQAVGDTLCAGGIMYGQRNIPQVLAFCKDIREVAKNDVLFLNYSNPNAMNTWAAIQHGRVNTVGLCHGVMGGHSQITEVIEFLVNKGKTPGSAGYRKVSKKEVDIICAGINHQTWYIQVLFDGKDWTGRMLEGFQKHPTMRYGERVRIDMLKRFGYYSTESNSHLSEYIPWYRKRPGELKNWVLGGGEVGDTGSYLLGCIAGRNGFVREFNQILKSPPRKITAEGRGIEHGSYILEGLETGRLYRGHFNVQNNGCITNLPDDCVVEVPGYVDHNGINIPRVGDLPLGAAAVCNASISVQRLSVQAALTGDVTLLKQAMMMDPLTGAVLSPPELSQMTDEMLIVQQQWLPNYKKAIPAAAARFKSEPRLGTKTHAFSRLVKFIQHVENIRDWQVVGPFPSPKPGAVTLDMPTPVEKAFAKLGAGRVDLKAQYGNRGQTPISSAKSVSVPDFLTWKPVHTVGGLVDLDKYVGRAEWACAYGYTEIHSSKAQSVFFGFGSDDGIKVWLNGKVVHVNEVQRGCAGVADTVELKLQKGANRLLVKIDNYISGWSFMGGFERTSGVVAG